MNMHRSVFLVGLLAAVYLLTGCLDKSSVNNEKSMLQADRFYSLLSEQKGRNAAFIAMFDSAGVMLRAGSRPVEGLKAISSLLLSKSDSAYTLTWEPAMSRVARSGDLGYTYGTWQLRLKPAGTVSGTGTYVTIWKKDPDGSWKALLDTGNEGLGDN